MRYPRLFVWAKPLSVVVAHQVTCERDTDTDAAPTASGLFFVLSPLFLFHLFDEATGTHKMKPAVSCLSLISCVLTFAAAAVCIFVLRTYWYVIRCYK